MPSNILSFSDSLARVRDLLNDTDRRIIIGIVGKPGAGKSTLSSYLLENLPRDLVTLVPMDGYHLSNKILEKLERRDRKGAPDTFDSDGYSALIDRIARSKDNVYFPIFHREIEESIAAEGVVMKSTRIVLTEGNYLLHDEGSWKKVQSFLDETWFVEVDDSTRLERLVRRHHHFGKSLQESFDWAHGTDERNAEIVEKARNQADFIVINEGN